jgi:hypothetical protein
VKANNEKMHPLGEDSSRRALLFRVATFLLFLAGFE